MRSEIKGKLDAGTLAELCLGYLAENPEELGNFMGLAGYGPKSLQQAVGSAELTMGLLDYFAGNEALLLSLCANNNLTPESFMRVYYQLNPAG